MPKTVDCVFNLEDIFPYISTQESNPSQILLKGIWSLRLVPLIIKSWWKREMRLSLDVVRGKKRKKTFGLDFPKFYVRRWTW